MDKIVETKCYNCKTIIRINLSEIDPGATVYCPKCNLAQSHVNKILQDTLRVQGDK